LNPVFLLVTTLKTGVRALFWISWFWSIATMLPAKISWTEKTVQRVAKPSDLTVSADYTFKNSGSTPVKVTSVTTSCGCTTTQLDKQSYAPGETGKLTALFEIGSRSGPQEKTITVVSNDGTAATTTLVLRVDIPELVALSPRLLIWSRGREHRKGSHVHRHRRNRSASTRCPKHRSTLQNRTHRR